jgi:cysteinyl-tRNA synthetase
MFRLYDPATGQPEPARPARPGELRLWVAGPGARSAVLRSCLVADLVRRVAERHHLRVTAWQQPPGGDAAGLGNGSEQDLRTAWDRLNIYPAEFSASPPDRPDVAVGPAGQPAGSPAHRIQPAEVRPVEPDAAGLDPLALRLAFLEYRYAEPAALTRDTLVAADQTLRRWRELVARWALSPSKPMCAQYTGDVFAAFDNDLDSPAALRALHALAADAEIPPGSKFETFAYLDQLFGLDLAREVGR